jgi:SulP family sulfate permease
MEVLTNRRTRAISLGDDIDESRERIITGEEEWDQTRKQKLIRIIQRTSSDINLAPFKGNLGKYSPTTDRLMDLKDEFAKHPNPAAVSVMYGIVNAVIVLPVLMSFGNIIFHDDFFRPFLPVLVKLTVISGTIHQLCFSTFSTLPFAVGSVQDAGLIFLSTIASNIVKQCQERGYDDEVTLATTLVGLSLFTAVLGTGLIVIGRLKLAQYVQKLPTPVVGGYLAFIGFFCGQSALSLMAKKQVSGILEWWKFLHRESIYLMTPGILGGCGIYMAVRKIKHMAVLPTSIMIILATFYIVLKFCGISLDDAKNLGLMSQADTPPSWNHTWDYIKFDKVVWEIFPDQLFTVISMIFVVALSSSLDIAAIDLEVPKPLAYNHELKMIGLSNLVSGLLGGYTGSYIFSQSIFSLRAGIRSRLAGFITAGMQAVTVVLPVSILAIVPNFVFASLLIMICIDLMIEWLWDVRKKLSRLEYMVTVTTFCLMQVLGVEYGIMSGAAFFLVTKRMQSNVSSDITTVDERTPILRGNDSFESTEKYAIGISMEETSEMTKMYRDDLK